MTTYIADTDHYSKVIAQIPKVKRLLWIATADLKDLYVEKKGGTVVPLLQILWSFGDVAKLSKAYTKNNWI